MKSYLSRKMLLGFLASIGTISALGVGSFLYILKVIEYSRIGGQSHQVLLLTEEVTTAAYEHEFYRERQTRGFDASFSGVQQAAYDKLLDRLEKLDSLTRSSAPEAALVSRLRKALESAAIPEAPLPLDSLAAVVGAIKSIEHDARIDRMAAVTNQFYQFAFAFTALILVGLVLPSALAFALNKNLKKRSEYEEKLALATTTVQDLYDNAPCGYFSLNADGIFTHANRTLVQWLGYGRNELVDRLHFKDVFSAEQETLGKLDLNHGEAERDGAMGLEVLVMRKDSTTFPVSVNRSIIKDKHGRTSSSRCTLFDLTELKKAEEEVKRTNRELEAFANSVSHDLRAPLRSIGGFAKILLEDYAPRLDAQGSQHLSRISTNAQLMGQLIEDLLDFAKVGTQEMSRTNINLDEFVRNTSRELVHREERKILINIEPMGSCIADEKMLKQAWSNLISNAIKYTGKRERPLIEIGKMNGNGEPVFFIKDNGVGFDMKSSEKLFGVFQRLHRNGDFDGNGVGLALVKRIVERHNGRIWAEAKLDEGATFYFTLPPN